MERLSKIHDFGWAPAEAAASGNMVEGVATMQPPPRRNRRRAAMRGGKSAPRRQRGVF